MDFIIVIGISAILVATGVISPKPKDDEVAEAEVVKTEEVVTPPTEIKPDPEPKKGLLITFLIPLIQISNLVITSFIDLKLYEKKSSFIEISSLK